MKGCRPLSIREVKQITEAFREDGCRIPDYQKRNRAIFLLGCYTGERAQAILSLRLSDVCENGAVSDFVTYRKATRKGKIESHVVKLHPRAKQALSDWLKVWSDGLPLDGRAAAMLIVHSDWSNRRIAEALKCGAETLSCPHKCPRFSSMRAMQKTGKRGFLSSAGSPGQNPDGFVFYSRKHHRLCRHEFHRILKRITRKLRLPGKIATHSMRKFFATRIYELSGHDLFLTSKALGHKSINNTILYLDCREKDLEETMMRM